MSSSSGGRGAIVSIFLADGSPRGFRTVERDNWSGIVALVGREQFPAVKRREVFGRPGVYLLVGPPAEPNGRPALYVGQADNARNRLDHHLRGKPFWSELALFTSKDVNLHKAHALHIESRLIDLARAAQRADMQNGNAPDPPTLSEVDRSYAEAFMDHVLLLCPLLGLDFFEPPPAVAPPADPPTPVPADSADLLLVARGVQASGRLHGGGLLVFAGAVARLDVSPAMPAGYGAIRAALIASGAFAEQDDSLVLKANHLFGSPSAAAAVLLGTAANGRRTWKDARGRTLDEIEREGTRGE